MKEIIIDLEKEEKTTINVKGYESFTIADKRLLEELIEWAFVSPKEKDA